MVVSSGMQNDLELEQTNHLSQKRNYLCLSGKEDAANNFARGHYTVGKEVIDMVGPLTISLANK